MRYTGIQNSLPATLESWVYISQYLFNSNDNELIFFSEAFSIQTVVSLSQNNIGCAHKQDLTNTFKTFKNKFPSFSQYSGWMHLSCGYEATKLHQGYNEDLKEEAVNIPTFATASITAGYFT